MDTRCLLECWNARTFRGVKWVGGYDSLDIECDLAVMGDDSLGINEGSAVGWGVWVKGTVGVGFDSDCNSGGDWKSENFQTTIFNIGYQRRSAG